MRGTRVGLSAFIFVLSAASFANVLPFVALDAAKPDPEFFTPKFKLASAITIRYKPEADTQMRVQMVGQKKDGKLTCKLLAEDDVFKAKAKWNPLPLYLFTPKSKEGKVSPVFEEHLDFPDGTKEFDESEIEFAVKFEKGDYKFQSLWRITPHVSVKDGVASCAAVTQVCPASELLIDEKGKHSCKRKEGWAWINRITALPDLTAYYTQNLEIITSLVASFVAKRADGSLVMTEKPIQ